MDRSVDSIGSCSLDVDADSTDFSDTSGELNFLTPISGKDITREFTAGIKERCMLPVINCQAVTSVLDPVTGHISTVLTTTTAPNGQQQQQQQALQPLLSGTGDSSPTAATNKKPSYLNLACCVNGYSNLTTYDSKLRQDINKSREVSPSRPIIATLHYNRTETGAGGHLLAAPTLSYVSMNNTINNNNNNNNNNYSASTGGNRMLKMNGAGVVNGGAAGRMRGMNGSILSPPSGGGADMTDNVGMFNGNGSFAGSMRTKVISSQSQISSHARDEATAQLLMTPKKSFIQQRVEKLYGASEVVVLNKQNYSSSERKYLNNIANDNTSGGASVKLIHHSSTAQAGQQQQHHHHSMGNGTARNGVANGAAGGLHVTNGGTNGGSVHDENGKQLNGAAEVSNGSDEADVESLPVLRHLRPEFRAQLQIFSPKKMPKPAAPPANRTTAVNGSAATHANGNTAEENVTLTTGPKRYTQANGNSSNTDHLEQQQHSLVREEQDHRTTVTNRSTMVVKNARISSHTTTTSSSTNGRTAVEEEEEEENALLTSNHHHSNATSARSSTITEAKQQQQHTTGVVTEQHHHETASQSRSSSTDMSTTTTTTKTSMAAVTSSKTVIVEEKMRSLVVVSPSSATAADNGVGRMSTADGGNAIATAAATVVPDEPKPTTVVAASVIENGVQNGVRQSSDTITNGLESVVPAVSVKKEEVLVVGGGEIVNCDNSSQFVADNMRTANGGSTVVMEPVAASSITLPAVATMADFVHPVAEGGIQSNGKPIEVTTNGQGSNDSSFSSSNNNIVLDGNHFLRILKTEQNRLKAMADEVEQEINLLKADGVEFGEDINGYILVAVGKARLLCSQKMKQFEDLCYTNLNQSPDEKFQTTGEDLRGFWDMVMLQVNNVDASFAEIDSFRKNGWRKPAPKSPPPPARNGTAGATRTKLVKRPYKTGGTANGSTVTDGSNGVEAKKASAALAAAKREAQRKQLMEMKRKQKLANSQQQTAVEIFAPASDEPAAQQNGVGGGDDNNCSTAVVPPVGTAAAAATTTLVDTS
ncbi:myb-like protein A isoform X1 [Anopheles merus]|uniref:myb-like protein A isoform X1 n=2 Tax=Anopheles merus TaxID=30066 RepID=UPI001BE414EA|nr:myb-like protein A isoform X1 [Anopheles merus]XP_041780639.1 myb-like protein A isoform X1 [Anopheles merus]